MKASDIYSGIISSIVVAILGVIATWLRSRLAMVFNRKDPRITSYILSTLLLLWCIAGILILYFVLTQNKFTSLLPAWFIWAFIMYFYLWRQRTKLKAVGIVGADKTIKTGITYDNSLRLCMKRLDFLGIGAAKLTADINVFEETIKRCSQYHNVRLLLIDPKNKVLIDAAKRYDKPDTKYQQIVSDSLHKIASLRDKYQNVEVRFYADFQPFRIMFIDDSICLASYYVMGEGDGSQLPQLHILNAREGCREAESFYYPLRSYFEDLWEKAKPWDFKEYL